MNPVICSWNANINATLDIDYATITISDSKGAQLEPELNKGGFYYLTLQAGFDIEIIKVIAAIKGVLTVERGQLGTHPGIWAAGTLLQARIPARTLEDLNLDVNDLISSNNEVLVAPNGDIITKPVELAPNQMFNH